LQAHLYKTVKHQSIAGSSNQEKRAEMAITLKSGYKMPIVGLGVWRMILFSCNGRKLSFGMGQIHYSVCFVYPGHYVMMEQWQLLDQSLQQLRTPYLCKLSWV